MTRSQAIGRLRVAVLLGTCTLAAAQPVAGQIPEKYDNLKVLPQSITRDELVPIMRGFALGLGVRCHYCHVGDEDQPFSEYDFASDDKAEKRKARFMLEMVRYLNGERLPQMASTVSAERREPPVEITCATCHRGVAVPRPLEHVLAITIATDGVEAAVAEYARLREEYYGSGAYDFGEQPLADLGRRLFREGQTAAAVRILELNLTHFSRSFQTLVLAGEAHARVGNRARAIELLELAAAMQPTDERLARRVEELRRGRQPPGREPDSLR